MKTIVDYKIVIGASKKGTSAIEELAQEVNTHLADGWQPLGRSYVSNDTTLLQTLIRAEKE